MQYLLLARGFQLGSAFSNFTRTLCIHILFISFKGKYVAVIRAVNPKAFSQQRDFRSNSGLKIINPRIRYTIISLLHFCLQPNRLAIIVYWPTSFTFSLVCLLLLMILSVLFLLLSRSVPLRSTKSQICMYVTQLH